MSTEYIITFRLFKKYCQEKHSSSMRPGKFTCMYYAIGQKCNEKDCPVLKKLDCLIDVEVK